MKLVIFWGFQSELMFKLHLTCLINQYYITIKVIFFRTVVNKLKFTPMNNLEDKCILRLKHIQFDYDGTFEKCVSSKSVYQLNLIYLLILYLFYSY